MISQKTKSLVGTIGTGWAAFGLLAAPALAGTFAPEINKLTSATRIEALVTYKATAGTRNRVYAAGATYVGEAGDAEVWRCSVAAAKAIAAQSSVAHVSLNHPLLATGIPVYDYLPETLQKSVKDLQSVDFTKGQGIGVAVIDSGVNVGPDLTGNGTGTSFIRVVYAQSFVPGDKSVTDFYGHGTHIAGIIAGDASNSTGPAYSHAIKGIAPGANIISLKVLDANGASSDAVVIQAIEKAISLQRQYNIKVINLSLGRPVFESFRDDPLCKEVEKAWLHGIAVVVAAGNSGRYTMTSGNAKTQGYDSITAPANDPLVITVGAMNTESTATRLDDLMTTYSSKGPTLGDHVVKPDLVAPGNMIFSIRSVGSTLETGGDNPQRIVPLASYEYNQPPATCFGKTCSNYMFLNGTSMAAGATSGAIAALITSGGSNNSLTPDQIKARLMKTASKAFPRTSIIIGQLIHYDIFTVGAGYLDLDAAIASNAIAPISKLAASPVAAPRIGKNGKPLVTNGHLSVIVGNEPIVKVLDDSIVWGSDDSIVWGSDDSIVWGSDDSIVWGSSVWGPNVWAQDADSIVWGSDDSIVWGSDDDSIVWGSDESIVWGSDESIVWGSADSIVWGSDDSIVWGSSVMWGSYMNGDPDTGR
jgi:serine protease AprX